jgi:hypothetical protein
VVDHHVDRPEVEAGQPAQLTGTNRSIALERPHPAARIILPDDAPEAEPQGRQTLLCGGTAFRRDTHATRFEQNPGINIPGIIDPGDQRLGREPDRPVPNQSFSNRAWWP